MKDRRILDMAISAILIAIIALMTFVPYVGFIGIPGTPISVCTIHIIVIVASMLFGWKQGTITGLAFGVCSLLKAAIMPVAVSDILFVNPLISVLPRVIFGLVTGIIFDALRGMKSPVGKKVLFFANSIIMTAVHSALVLSAFWFFSADELGDGFMFVFGTIIGINTLIEALSAAIIATPLALAIGKAKRKYNPFERNETTLCITFKGVAYVLLLVGLIIAFYIAPTIYMKIAFVVFMVAIVTLLIVEIRREKKYVK